MNEYWQPFAPGTGAPGAAGSLPSPVAAPPSSVRPGGTKRKQQQLKTDIPPDLSREELSRMTRTEKKAHREKKRRNQVNKGIEDLTSLLKEIDPEITGAEGTEDDFSMNRVDLIQKTVVVLRKLHEDYLHNKAIVQDMRESEKQAEEEKDEEADDGGSEEKTEKQPASLKAAPSVSSDASSVGGEKQEELSSPGEEKQVVVVVPYLTPVPESLTNPYPNQHPWRAAGQPPPPLPPPPPPPPIPPRPRIPPPPGAGRQLYYNYDYPLSSHPSTLRASSTL